MNYSSSATALARRARACACRARALAPQSTTVPTALASSSALAARRGATRSFSRCRRIPVPQQHQQHHHQQQQQQQRAFSSACLLHQAQPVTDLPPASSEGLDASILGKASDDGANVSPSILSRATTDSDLKRSSTSLPPSSSQAQAPPSSPEEKTTPSSSWDPSLIYPSRSSSSSSSSSSSPPSGHHEVPDPDDAAFLSTSPTLVGTVSRVGTMQKTVRVTRPIQVWHAQFQKHYTRPTHSLVHDPHNLLLEGDVVRFGAFPPSMRRERDRRGQVVVKRHRPRDRNGMVKEQGVRYIVREVISPFGVPVEQRRPRTVGGDKGRWLGTEGEVKKLALRQKGRRDGKGGSAGSRSRSRSSKKTQAPKANQGATVEA
ncbi:uncharacterized protein PV07_07858 [Cladophialophora immunda]|uniref:Ribosomal protein S17 n=1 Tax=Cladophialophora immunda TaxID=569365 RepID=A0A0D2CCX0_9EURO|nr:uncharacterized protein PV07_07858 [Cladophialophora immunda]KIW28175.1 hypothetical protein PV07_07858 [Cladophialophora immunda]